MTNQNQKNLLNLNQDYLKDLSVKQQESLTGGAGSSSGIIDGCIKSPFPSGYNSSKKSNAIAIQMLHLQAE